jgi:PAS domain-containing protein
MTAQKQAFDAARSMIEASLDSLVAISPEGKITDVNEATVKATGVSRDQLIGTAFSDYFTEPEKANEIYQRVFAQGMAVDYPLRTRKQITSTYTFLGVMVVLCRLPWMSKSRWRESLPRCFSILMSVSDG